MNHKYLFRAESLSMELRTGIIETKIKSTCFFCESQLDSVFTIDIVCHKKNEDKITIKSIDIRNKGGRSAAPSSSPEFESYLQGYFTLPCSMSFAKALQDIVKSLNGEDVPVLDKDQIDIFEKWNNFSNAIIEWVKKRIMPTIKKEFEIYDIFFNDQD